MLTQNVKLEDGKVYGFKLTSGEEVIATLVTKQNGEYILGKPHVVIMNQNGPGLNAWPISADEEAHKTVPQSSIVTVYVLRDDFLQGYNAAVTPESEIIAPDSRIIT